MTATPEFAGRLAKSAARWTGGLETATDVTKLERFAVAGSRAYVSTESLLRRQRGVSEPVVVSARRRSVDGEVIAAKS